MGSTNRPTDILADTWRPHCPIFNTPRIFTNSSRAKLSEHLISAAKSANNRHWIPGATVNSRSRSVAADERESAIKMQMKWKIQMTISYAISSSRAGPRAPMSNLFAAANETYMRGSLLQTIGHRGGCSGSGLKLMMTERTARVCDDACVYVFVCAYFACVGGWISFNGYDVF